MSENTNNTEIIKAIASLETKIDNIDKRFEVLDKVQKTIFTGNGRPSLLVELDRCSQQLSRLNWMTRACIVVVLGLLGSELFSHFRHYAEIAAIERVQGQILKIEQSQPKQAPTKPQN